MKKGDKVMKNQSFGGGLTIPTETGFVEETLELLKRWGADAVRRRLPA